MSPAQKRVYDAIVSGPRGGARGPFNTLLRSPELAVMPALSEQIDDTDSQGARDAFEGVQVGWVLGALQARQRDAIDACLGGQ